VKDNLAMDHSVVNFDARAVLRKWPSLRNERQTEGTGPYLLVDGTLDECLQEFVAKPAGTRHLYEIHTSLQSRLVSRVPSEDTVVDLARLRNFDPCNSICQAPHGRLSRAELTRYF
jgi:hypothetical protein